MLLVLNACGSSANNASFVSGDGVLDCLDGQVVRSADIDVSAESELKAVAAALGRWTAEGADLVELPADESWSAALDGRDVAIAYPEVDGTGTWVVHDVRTCGEPETGPAVIDGKLDCSSDISWSVQGSVREDTAGSPTPQVELEQSLSPYLARHGGEVVVVEDQIGSLVVEGREVVVSIATEAPAGGWIVLTTGGCEGYEI